MTSKMSAPETPQMVIDYMTFSNSREGGLIYTLPPFKPFESLGETDIRALHGYDRAEELRCGGRVMWHTKRVEMGYCITLTGAACNDVSWQGVDRQELMVWLHDTGHHFSRVDFAMDLVAELFVPVPLFDEWYKEGHITTKSSRQKNIEETIKKKGKIEPAGGGVYLGQRNSALMVRYYDKAAERHIMGVSWARLEAEIKKDRARAALAGIKRVGWRSFAASQMFYAMGVSNDAPEYIKQWYAILRDNFFAAPYQPLVKHEGDINKFIELIVLPCIAKRGAGIRPDLLEKLAGAVAHHLNNAL